MFKADIEYSCNTLFITVEGIINEKHLDLLRQKLYLILNEKNINNVLIKMKNIIDIDFECFNSFLYEYDIRYGGNIDTIKL